MDRGTLRTLARSLFDEPSAEFISDLEFNTFLDLGQRYYVNKIGQAFEHYFGTSSFISYVADQELYAFPADAMLRVLTRLVDKFRTLAPKNSSRKTRINRKFFT